MDDHRDRDVDPDTGALRAAEALALELINETRGKQGLRAYVCSQRLAAVCRRHAEDMARRGFAGHFTPEGVGAQARLARAGIVAWAMAENCGLVRVPDTMAVTEHLPYVIRDTHDGFLASPGHRTAILDPESYLHAAVGVGVADQRVGVVQMFVRERRTTRRPDLLRIIGGLLRVPPARRAEPTGEDEPLLDGGPPARPGNGVSWSAVVEPDAQPGAPAARIADITVVAGTIAGFFLGFVAVMQSLWAWYRR